MRQLQEVFVYFGHYGECGYYGAPANTRKLINWTGCRIKIFDFFDDLQRFTFKNYFHKDVFIIKKYI